MSNGKYMLKLCSHPGGDNSNTIVTIFLASTSITRPTGTTMNLAWAWRENPSEGDKSQYSRYFGDEYLLWWCIWATFGYFLQVHKIARANESSFLLLALIFSKYHISFVNHLILFLLKPQVLLYPPKWICVDFPHFE